jgi:hypothetical protein
VERKGKLRQAFRKILGLISQKTAAQLEGMFKDKLLELL